MQNSIDINHLRNKFPKIELSYDKILHKKVYADMYLLIPMGIKSFAWFTYYKNNKVCLIIHLNKYNNITKIEPCMLCFEKSLSIGTVLYGTYFSIKDKKYFSCEDIFYYKDVFINDWDYIKRFEIIKEIFNGKLKQIYYTKNSVIFGLPIMSNKLYDLFNTIPLIMYRVKGIQFRKLNNQREIGLLLTKQNINIECIFKVKADIEFDIYNLYCRNYKDDMDDLYNVACIPDYKTSIMMNDLYRIIKENKNLDLLEESDSEEEFENIDTNKFVNLNKSYFINCVFIKKFNKWKPIECIKNNKNNKNNKLLTRRDIYQLEKSL